ncbi:MAG TPA: CHASE2 domain-containing protein, partial [Leptolyngbyaceae cyanobacterium M65_K2018_010]|nr:CHASE2 domain-containing protein [Leptolyngbyaceae cyanobacterium M65_K2018_010]
GGGGGGFADLVIDPGGILRRSLLLVTPPQPPTPFPKQHLCNDYNQTLLSMGLRAALVYLQNRGMQPSFSEAGQLMLGSTAIPPINPNTGGYRRADTSGYQVMLRFRSETNAATQVSLMEVLEGRVDPELVRDRIVFLGYTTPQAKDDFYTPYSAAQADKQKMPGVIVHAQAASQLLATVLEGESLIWVWPHSAEWLWILAWSLGGGLLGWYFRHPAAFGLVIVLGAGGLYAISLSVFLRSGWIPLVPPALTFLGTAVGVVLLDRFNNSAYGQQVYRTVKTFLHLDIDIDEEKLEKQVAEITETDYFRDLQDTVKTLRESGDDPKAAPSRFNQAAPAWPGDLATTTTTDGEADAELEAIHRLLTPESPPPPRRDAPRPTAPEDSDDGLGFLGDLNQQAQQLKQQLQTEAPASPYQPFVLDSAFCRCQDTSEATEAYVQFIDREIQALKQGIRGKSAQHG